jgi:leucyl aminopeptidase
VRTTTLANPRQTLAVLGFLRRDATVFETLALAGRLLKESAARKPASLGVFAPGGASATPVLDALVQAALSYAFVMPSFRAPSRARERLRSIALPRASGVDLAYAGAASRANNLARWLTALPPNKLDAASYRRIIAALARERRISMRWLDEAALRRLGANAFLAVSAGNAQRSAGIAHLRYRPRARSSRSPAVALVGKGILFDTGGTNLKTHRAMLDMHTDMAGSAVALATLLALAELRSPIAADAWLAITENRTGPQAYRPQDVVRAANGVTIQVVHTDAEGRMVLADTLALAARTQPRLMLDFATLTGAAVYALTERMSAVFTNRPALEPTLLAAGRASGERVWSFPFDSDFDSDLESKVADVLQCAVDGKGDHILAARFMNRFVPREIAWAHVDLAAATRSGGLGHIGTDITGFGARYALELLLRQKALDALGRSA